MHAILALMTTLACGAAWGQSAAAAPDKSQPRTLSATEAPEELVYRIFFQEFAAYQRKADELEAQGQDAAAVRNHQRRLASLTDAELQAVAAQALPCAATVEANRRTSARLAQELKQSADKTAIQAQLIQLRRDNGAAVAAGVGQLRAVLGQQRFEYLDHLFFFNVL